jgi:hypothetical protein
VGEGDSQKHRQHGYRISLLLFLQNKKSGLRITHNGHIVFVGIFYLDYMGVTRVFLRGEGKGEDRKSV